MYQLDLRKKKVEDVFRRQRVKAIIHMGIMHDPRMSAEDHHSFNVSAPPGCSSAPPSTT